jgi:hypothetical protein
MSPKLFVVSKVDLEQIQIKLNYRPWYGKLLGITLGITLEINILKKTYKQ